MLGTRLAFLMTDSHNEKITDPRAACQAHPRWMKPAAPKAGVAWFAGSFEF